MCGVLYNSKKGFEVSINGLSKDSKQIYRKFLKERWREGKEEKTAHFTSTSLCPAICQHLVQPGDHRSLLTTHELARKMGSAAPYPDLVLITLILASLYARPVPEGKCRELTA